MIQVLSEILQILFLTLWYILSNVWFLLFDILLWRVCLPCIVALWHCSVAIIIFGWNVFFESLVPICYILIRRIVTNGWYVWINSIKLLWYVSVDILMPFLWHAVSACLVPLLHFLLWIVPSNLVNFICEFFSNSLLKIEIFAHISATSLVDNWLWNPLPENLLQLALRNVFFWCYIFFIISAFAVLRVRPIVSVPFVGFFIVLTWPMIAPKFGGFVILFCLCGFVYRWRMRRQQRTGLDADFALRRRTDIQYSRRRSIADALDEPVAINNSLQVLSNIQSSRRRTIVVPRTDFRENIFEVNTLTNRLRRHTTDIVNEATIADVLDGPIAINNSLLVPSNLSRTTNIVNEVPPTSTPSLVVSSTDEDVCSICYVNYATRGKRTLSCGHYYHTDCIDAWERNQITQEKTCPVSFPCESARYMYMCAYMPVQCVYMCI